MYYKIVDKNLNSFYSSYLNSMSIKYKKKEWVKPIQEYAPLCVFEDMISVRDFLKNNKLSNYDIFECAIEKSDKKWNRLVRLSADWPHGTILADRVMLIRNINDQEPTKTYFKITVPGLLSTSSESRRMKLDIKYELNSWVAPRETYAPLMIFDTFDAAKLFRDTGSFPEEKWEIYECHAIKSNKKWGYIPDNERLEKIIKAIKNKQNRSSFFEKSLPNGTVFADAVKLLERVL